MKQYPRGQAKLGQQGIYFFFAAAGHDADMITLRGNGVQRGQINDVHQGVAHIFHSQVVTGVEIHLKGQNGNDLADIFFKKMHPPRAPGPYFGADVIIGGNAQIIGDARHPEVEFRRVHQNDRRGPRGFKVTADIAQHAQGAGQGGKDLREAHDRKLFNAVNFGYPRRS